MGVDFAATSEVHCFASVWLLYILQSSGCLQCHLTGDRVNLAAPDEWHSCRHDGHELHVGIERQLGHLQHRPGNVFDIHHRFRQALTIRLRHTFGHGLGHWRSRIADIDLAAGNVIVSAIQ